MPILNSRKVTNCKGFSNEYESLEILLDRFPEFVFREIETESGIFFYAETEEGLVECYKYLPNSTEGFGGRRMTLKMVDGSTREFNGQLWNSWERHHCPEIPKHKEISATNEQKAWDRGYTFCSMSVTEAVYNRLMAAV